MRKINVLISLLLLVICLGYENIDGGFCDIDHHQGRIFPLSPPERHIPWIWDAVLMPKEQMVELTMISRNACKFNKTTWKTIVKMHPDIAYQMGDGKEENIYVPTDPTFDYARFNPRLKGELGRGLQTSYCMCVYLNDDTEVARVKSKRIDDVEIAELSTLQIRCPLPNPSVIWNHMKIERILSHLPEERDLLKESAPFSVCQENDLQVKSEIHHSHQNKSLEYEYDLTLCTATSRANRPQLVEWLEYHLMLGIEHFYLYDTTHWDHPVEKSLVMILRDYIRRGIVTVVRWPYESCVKNMASGRWVNYIVVDENNGSPSSRFFQPPRAIAQTAALASCYSRFKRKTKWMAHIDDDEFLAFDMGRKIWDKKINSLLDLVELLSQQTPEAPAYYFQPLCVDDCSICPDTTAVAYHPLTSMLPRYGKWNKAHFCPDWEGKLIMRTAAIGMFFTHYITLREEGSWSREPVKIPRDHAAVLHYKVPNDITGSVYGSTLPTMRYRYSRNCPRPHHIKAGINATKILDRLTRYLIPSLERRYISQIMEVGPNRR